MPAEKSDAMTPLKQPLAAKRRANRPLPQLMSTSTWSGRTVVRWLGKTEETNNTFRVLLVLLLHRKRRGKQGRAGHTRLCRGEHAE